jgi:hypothetical protein
MKYIKYFGWLFGVLSIIILLVLLFDPNNERMIGWFLTWGYILVAIASVAALGLPLIYMMKNPKMLKKLFMNIGIILAVGIVSYLLATGSPVQIIGATQQPTPEVLKWTDTGLIAMYILIIAATLSIFVGGIVNMIRNR